MLENAAPMLVDSHCHLDFPDFADDLDDVLERAADNGVKQMLTIGTKLSTFQDTLAVARRYEHVYCSVGIHPHEAEREAPMASIDVLGSRAGHEKVVGIGETGLDFTTNTARKQSRGYLSPPYRRFQGNRFADYRSYARRRRRDDPNFTG